MEIEVPLRGGDHGGIGLVDEAVEHILLPPDLGFVAGAKAIIENALLSANTVAPPESQSQGGLGAKRPVLISFSDRGKEGNLSEAADIEFVSSYFKSGCEEGARKTAQKIEMASKIPFCIHRCRGSEIEGAVFHRNFTRNKFQIRASSKSNEIPIFIENRKALL